MEKKKKKLEKKNKKLKREEKELNDESIFKMMVKFEQGEDYDGDYINYLSKKEEEEEESSDDEVEIGSAEWFENYGINSYMEFLQKEDDDDSESIIKNLN
jgi:hypothetical protein